MEPTVNSQLHADTTLMKINTRIKIVEAMLILIGKLLKTTLKTIVKENSFVG